MEKVSVAAEWDNFWSAITSSNPQVTGVLSFLGIAIAVWAVIVWIRDSRRGSTTQAGKGPMWMLFLGLALCAPGVVLPLVLGLFDIIANLVMGLLGGVVGAESAEPPTP